MSKYIPIGLLLGWLLSLSAHAIGLGPLEIHSSLNQPFAGSVRLFALGDVPLSDLQAKIASEEYYQRANLDRTVTIGKLKFEIVRSQGGYPIIWITSDDRITDLFVQILLELSWPEGRTYRAYTILLDPSDYHTAVNDPSRLPERQTASQLANPQPAPIISARSTATTTSPSSGSTYASDSAAPIYGPVQSGEALWNIVQKVKPGSSVTIQQAMLAIVDINPKAFINGNVNGLKAGYQLKIPDLEVMQSVPAATALQEVEQHDRAWRAAQPIEHILEPPYTKNEAGEDSQQRAANNTIETPAPDVQESQQTPAVTQVQLEEAPPSVLAPAFASSASAAPQQDATLNDFTFIDLEKSTDNDTGLVAVIRAELLETSAAVNTLTETNLAMQQQFEDLTVQNQQLQTQLGNSNDEIALLKSQLIDLLKTNGQVAAADNQAAAIPVSTSERSYIKLMLLIIISLGLATMLGWRIYQSRANEALNIDDISDFEPEPSDADSSEEETINSNEMQENTTKTSVSAEKLYQASSQERNDSAEKQEAAFNTPAATDEQYDAPSQEETAIEAEAPATDRKPHEATDNEETPATDLSSSEQNETNDLPILDIDMQIEPTIPTESTAATDTDDEQAQNRDTLKFSSYSDDSMQLDKSHEPAQDPASEEIEEDAAKDTTKNGLSEADIKAFTGTDEKDIIATKMDLAKTYIEMGELNDAKQLLVEVIKQGDEKQIQAAKELLQQINSDLP